jgi:hypothetical protein
VDKAGNVYVADVDFDLVNNVPITSRIRKISPTGVVTTLAGGDHEGSADGVGTLATFAGASSVAVDSQGDVFVADAGNQLIRKIAPDGTVSTLAGQGSGSSQILDGTGRSASFSYLLHGLTVDASDNLYVRDARYVRKITPSGVVSTLSGTAMAGTPSATTTWLTFNQNYGVAVDKSNNVYVFEQVAPRIRKISPEGVLSTLAGSGTIGTADGTGTGASFFNPWGLDIDSSGVLYVADGNGLGNMAGDPNVFNGVRRVSPDGVVTTIAGPLYGAGGSADGTGSHATFNSPIDVAVDASGNLWVSDAGNYLIRKIIHIP